MRSPLICDQFLAQARTAPGAVAVHHRGEDFSYGELAGTSSDIAHWLVSVDARPGDRVVVLLKNSMEYVAAWLGVLRAGCVVVALNPQVTPAELEAIVADCEPIAIIVESRRVREIAPLARQARSVRQLITLAGCGEIAAREDHEQAAAIATPDLPVIAPEDKAQIIYTSGTTGRPKGVVLTHANLAANCRSIISYLKLTADDGVLVVLPFFYSYGNSLLITHLACGGRLVLAADSVFWSRTTALMREQKVTGFAGVPSTYSLLLHQSDFRTSEFPDLRYLTCAGGRLAPALAADVKSVVPHAELHLMYGQTEATARLATLSPADFPRKAGSIGQAIPGVELDVVDDSGASLPAGEIGELVARGENIMSGYWNDPRLTSEVIRDGALRTGDLGFRDDEGFLFLSGRKDDMIKSGGHRVFPSEIEDVLCQIPGVAEAAVVGVSDELLYERPVAALVLTSAAGGPDLETVLRYCSEHLPPHKRPHEVVFLPELPKTVSGKIKRSEVRQLLYAPATGIAAKVCSLT